MNYSLMDFILLFLVHEAIKTEKSLSTSKKKKCIFVRTFSESEKCCMNIWDDFHICKMFCVFSTRVDTLEDRKYPLQLKCVNYN